MPVMVNYHFPSISPNSPSLLNDSSSGTTLRGPDNGLEDDDITGILCEEQGEVRAPGNL